MSDQARGGIVTKRRRRLVIWEEGNGPYTYVGKDGKTYLLTDDDIVKLQAEAEAGYDPSRFVSRDE